MKNQEKKWILFGDCPKCGADAEVLTSSKKDNFVFDGEEARCTWCSNTGTVNVEDSECADISWEDDEFNY